MSMYLFAVAALICAFVVFAHVRMGGRIFLRPFLALEIDPFLKSMGHFSWHIGTLVLGLIALGYTAAALIEDYFGYAVISTAIALVLVLLATAIAVRAKIPVRSFPVVPVYCVVIVMGFAGILLAKLQ